jgi:ATP-dependent Clp protease, protease subunit
MSKICEIEQPNISQRYSDIYAVLASNRILFVSEDVTKDLAASLSAMLLFFDHKNNEEITLFINTNGGDTDALMNIYDIMQMIKSPIKTICIGKAYSAGAFILVAGTNGRRFITRNSAVMIHGVQLNMVYGSHNESANYLNFIKTHNNILMEKLAKHSGKDIETIKLDCKNDKYFDAEDALAYGLVDHIIG